MTIIPGFSLKNEQCFNEDKAIVVSSLQVFPELIARGPLSHRKSKEFRNRQIPRRGIQVLPTLGISLPGAKARLRRRRWCDALGILLGFRHDGIPSSLPFRIDRTRICDIQFPILISVLTMTIISPSNIDKFVQHRVDLRLTIESRVIGQLNKFSILRNKGPRFFY